MDADSFAAIHDIVSEKIKDMKKEKNGHIKEKGLPTGFRDFDLLTGGLQKGELIILGGRPSMGKTALALSIAGNVAIYGKKKVAYFSLEMSKGRLTNRILAKEAHVDGIHLDTCCITDKEWEKLINCAEMIADADLYIDDTMKTTIDDICNKCIALKKKSGLDLVIVDYLQLICSDEKDCKRQQELENISRRLKNLAKDLNTPVVILSQLSHAVELRENHRPMLTDLREAASLEDADMIVLLYRDDYYNAESKYRGIAEVTIARNRSGQEGTVLLKWNHCYAGFSDFNLEKPKISASVTKIVNLVCDEFGIEKDDVFSPISNEELVIPRKVITYFMDSCADLSLKKSKLMDNHDISAIAKDIYEVKQMIKTDSEFFEKIMRIEAKLRTPNLYSQHNAYFEVLRGLFGYE